MAGAAHSLLLKVQPIKSGVRFILKWCCDDQNEPARLLSSCKHAMSDWYTRYSASHSSCNAASSDLQQALVGLMKLRKIGKQCCRCCSFDSGKPVCILTWPRPRMMGQERCLRQMLSCQRAMLRTPQVKALRILARPDNDDSREIGLAGGLVCADYNCFVSSYPIQACTCTHDSPRVGLMRITSRLTSTTACQVMCVHLRYYKGQTLSALTFIAF